MSDVSQTDPDDIMAWGAHVSAEFRSGVRELCGRLGWAKDARSRIMACMGFETGYTFAPNVKNMAGSGAVGLIQFMPKTAVGLGTTVEQLAMMRPEEQLFYVEKYFKPHASKIKTLSDMYMAILLPKYISAPDDTVLFSDGAAYRQNSGLDADHDGKITKKEATANVLRSLLDGMRGEHVIGLTELSSRRSI